MIDFPTLYPSLTKYLPNWLERFYPSIARFGKGDGYPCGNQGVFIPKNRKCWTHPKTGQKLKKPLTYQMYQEAKVKSQKSRTEKGRTALDRREQELRNLNSTKDLDLDTEAKVKRERLIKLFDDLEKKEEVVGVHRKKITTPGHYDMMNSKEFIQNEVKKQKKRFKEILLFYGKGRGVGYADEINDRVIENQERILKSSQQFKKDFDNFLRKSRRLVQVQNPTNISAEIVASTDVDRKFVEKGLSEFSKLIEIPDLESIAGKPGIVNDSFSAPKRSYYSLGENAVHLGRSGGKKQAQVSDIVHELGHWLDQNHPEIKQEVSDFYERRTKGNPVVLLSDVVDYGGHQGELTKVDKFIHPYMGKVYKVDKATEVLSMGLELMHGNPAYLAKKDPEMFDFIYKVVRRGIRRK